MYIFNLSLNEEAIDMAMIEITIRDDHGNVIGGQAGRKYKLDLDRKPPDIVYEFRNLKKI